MFTFEDKSNKKCCLIPEVTGILQEMFREKWFYEYKKKPLKVFYLNRCYRYETPQKGRYREFTQFGIEILGGTPADKKKYEIESKEILNSVLNSFTNLDFNFKNEVKRGLGYYLANGFEVECESLGAQKQIAGGGTYQEGVGWAIGIDRLMIALS